MNPIDVVIPWVDGNDPTWIKVHDQYTSDRLSDNHVSRYRAWDTFRYWFRAIEENAPWVRKIHFLTFGHYPKWLNIHHEKIHLVRHEDFIPKEYLPTFSSHVIELNLHRIPDLAEQFIYFNDDVYLNLPSQPDDFFENGLPKDAAVLGVIKNNLRENFMPYIMLNIMALINEKFDKKEVISKHWSKWINVKYGRLALNNIYLLAFGCFTCFRNF
ncbi:stealth family protein, partial [Bulleidia extructa]